MATAPSVPASGRSILDGGGEKVDDGNKEKNDVASVSTTPKDARDRPRKARANEKHANTCVGATESRNDGNDMLQNNAARRVARMKRVNREPRYRSTRESPSGRAAIREFLEV